MENRNRKMALVLLTGAAVGAVIGAGMGVLFAPRKGSKTRRIIRHSAVGTKHDVSNWLKHAKDELTKTAHEKKEAFAKKLDETVSSMSYKAEDIITSLEAKLEDLKKKNAQLQK
ncbi:YtxH domain-containing protein [Gelidibacter salicanalis]|uniref:YtxH domain-containing protein n=1 Tax=Gelidibacter salicanalis TaxID=291193 RepID=A0A934NIJ9_9FLAO|nr:YtxH domain-containing protein [Gelidibacter salicanalis]MBJ7880169.1 YtxH domain-containing protein [Gelidibacter salicanalis]